MSTQPESAAPPEPREILRILSRRKRMLIVPWLIAIALGVAAALLLPPVYMSNVTLLLERPQVLSGSLNNMVNPVDPERQADIMRDQVQSSVFLRGVVTATGLKSDPETRAWAARQSSSYPGDTEDDKIEAFLIAKLRDAIIIKRPKGGNTFQITVEDRRPHRARQYAEAVANQFVLASKAAQLEAVRATQEFSVEQQQIYKRKLEDSEARLESFRRGMLTSSLTGSTVTDANLPRARAMLDQSELESDQARQRLGSLRAQNADMFRQYDPNRLSNSDVNALAAQIKGIERQIAQASLLGDDDGVSARASSARKMGELEMQLTQNAATAFPDASPDTRDALVRYRLAEIDYNAKEAGRAYLSGQVSGYEHHVVLSPDSDEQLKKLQAEVDNNQAFYNSFLQQSASAQITEAFENARVSGRFSILEPANLPGAPGRPNRPMLILLAFVLGGVVGVGSVLVVERHDQSVKNAEEIETLLGLPVLGAIPRVEELDRRRRRSRVKNGNGAQSAERDPGLLHRLKTESPLGLEFRRIYLKIGQTHGRTLPKTLLMTSSTRGEGKTTTTACLAITLARELQDRILLVDFDLRSPSLHRALGIPSSSWGLAQMLAQRKFDERFVRSTVLQNLDFLGAGKSDKPASELVDTESVKWFMQEASSRYPLVVLDCPPTLAVPDPLILGRAVEGVIYVIKAGQTIRKAAEYGVRVQREAKDNLLGVMMNDAGEILPHYYGYHDAYGHATEAMGGES